MQENAWKFGWVMAYPLDPDWQVGDDLWSGWGVRTMSSADAGYSPLEYHNGTVWPHDNSLIAWGLARAGRWEEALRIVRRLVEAAAHFEHQLPEVFAGFFRLDTPFPIAYPTAARPPSPGCQRGAGKLSMLTSSPCCTLPRIGPSLTTFADSGTGV